MILVQTVNLPESDLISVMGFFHNVVEYLTNVVVSCWKTDFIHKISQGQKLIMLQQRLGCTGRTTCHQICAIHSGNDL